MTTDTLKFTPVTRIDCRNKCEAGDPVDLLIAGYLALKKKDWEHCISNKRDFDECVHGCIFLDDSGRRLRPCHSHQKRISKQTLQECTRLLENAFSPGKPTFTSFEDAYDFVERHFPSKGVQQICIYDTTLRIVASSEYREKLMPKDYVYLHCGALTGAQYLWKIDALYKNLGKTHKPYFNHHSYPKNDCVVAIREFSPALRSLTSAYLEDFLCVCKDLLRGLYLQLSADL